LAWIGTGKKVLDVGCNDGSDALRIIEAGNTVEGIDISFNAVEQARKRGVSARVLDISSQPLPFPAESFDVVVAGEIIEHVIDTDKFLRILHDMLKPGGTLILTTPNLASLARRGMLLLGFNPFCEYSLEVPVSGARPVGHLRYFVKRDIENFLKVHGFKVEVLTGDGVNLGLFASRFLARLFPSLVVRFVVRARRM